MTSRYASNLKPLKFGFSVAPCKISGPRSETMDAQA
jgi:hypothetical protein